MAGRIHLITNNSTLNNTIACSAFSYIHDTLYNDMPSKSHAILLNEPNDSGFYTYKQYCNAYLIALETATDRHMWILAYAKQNTTKNRSDVDLKAFSVLSYTHNNGECSINDMKDVRHFIPDGAVTKLLMKYEVALDTSVEIRPQYITKFINSMIDACKTKKGIQYRGAFAIAKDSNLVATGGIIYDASRVKSPKKQPSYFVSYKITSKEKEDNTVEVIMKPYDDAACAKLSKFVDCNQYTVLPIGAASVEDDACLGVTVVSKKTWTERRRVMPLNGYDVNARNVQQTKDKFLADLRLTHKNAEIEFVDVFTYKTTQVYTSIVNEKGGVDL